MQMSGEQAIAAPRAKVWAALNDPEILRQCIPGCQSLDKEADDRMVAVAEIRIGPIGARFKGVVTLSDIDAPNGYTISGQGSGGIAGSAKGGAKVRLRDEAGGTVIVYEVEAEVGGRMAQLGGPIIDATAKNLAGKFFAKFGEVVGGGAAAPAATSALADAAPVSAPVATPSPAVTSGGGFPWGWALTVALAIIAGFQLGRSGEASWWVVVMVVLALTAAGAGYESGRRNGAAR